ncbi:MAG: peptidoglycan DD-metalloendopeptidase family protein [Prevotella sp.]|nr:peptidoglycan DD-metalloendopeptidase family protein [Prevotella sp.]
MPASGAWAQKRTTTAKKPVAATKPKAKAPTAKKPAATAGRKKEAVSVQSLQSQRKQIQQQIKEQERRLRNNEQDVRQRLRNLMVINTEIEGKRRVIDTIRHDISQLDMEIDTLLLHIDHLQGQLSHLKQNYVRSMRYMHRNRSSQSQLMFIFSADNVAQMFRRMRFMREYASYQRTQGEEVKAKQQEVVQKFQTLSAAQSQKKQLLDKGESERRSLEDKQTEQQSVVTTLKKEQKTIQNIIAQQKRKDAALNEQIDRLIAEEVARQKARAEAEAKRRAAAEAAKKRAAELARKRAEAEAAARENARRVAEAKAKEEKARQEAQAAKSEKARKAAERKAREAEEARQAAERRAESEAREHARIVDAARKEADELLKAPTEDMLISGNFESNRGRLPIPITGDYRIVSHFGQYNVEGLNNVTLDNKGINIQGAPGAQARSIFDGEVSAVFSFGGTMVVMVRHGSYISVYCNLASVNVHRGQKVLTRQALGRVGSENILQFQLRRETAKLNPESWLGR